MQYADDVSWMSTCVGKIDDVEKEVEIKLQNRDLKINKDKTEKFSFSNVNEAASDSWKKM